MNTRLFSFLGGEAGQWRVLRMETIAGDPISAVQRLNVVEGPVDEVSKGAIWVLRGMTSNERYIVRAEKDSLAAKQPALGRPEATFAALIPIRKLVHGGA